MALNAQPSFRSIGGTLLGFLYGLSLTIIGVLLAGAGHGTYLLLDIASAPLSFFGVVVSLVAPPLVWPALCGLLPYSSQKPYRQIVAVAVVFHYAAIPLVLFFETYSEWKYVENVWRANPMVMIIGLAIYLVGQVIIWVYWFKMGQRKS